MYVVTVYVVIIAFVDFCQRPFGFAYPLIALQVLGHGEVAITVILSVQTFCCIQKDLKHENLNSIYLRLKHVVLVLLALVKIEQEVVETMIGYKNELINLIYLHVILVFLGICVWILLIKKKNSCTNNTFLCDMILKKRKGKMFSAEESFRVEDIVIDFFAEIGSEKEYWEGLGRSKVEEWSEEVFKGLVLRKIDSDSQPNLGIKNKLNCLQCKELLHTH